MNCGPNGCSTGSARPAMSRRYASLSPLDALMSDFFGADVFGLPSQGATVRSRPAPTTQIPVNVEEHAAHVTVEALVPGFTKQEVELEFENDVLTIRTAAPDRNATSDAAASAEAQEASETVANSKPPRTVRREFARAAGSRQIRFSVPVDSARIEAEIRDGVLTIRLPKTAEAAPTRIRIA